jgi:hypothetical protein
MLKSFFYKRERERERERESEFTQQIGWEIGFRAAKLLICGILSFLAEYCQAKSVKKERKAKYHFN